MKTENKYIRIQEYNHTGKTRGFDVITKPGGYVLGDISWYGPWRQYCFTPVDDAGPLVFNSECLDLITDFLKDINIEHRKNWNQKKEES